MFGEKNITVGRNNQSQTILPERINVKTAEHKKIRNCRAGSAYFNQGRYSVL